MWYWKVLFGSRSDLQLLSWEESAEHHEPVQSLGRCTDMNTVVLYMFTPLYVICCKVGLVYRYLYFAIPSDSKGTVQLLYHTIYNATDMYILLYLFTLDLTLS